MKKALSILEIILIVFIVGVGICEIFELAKDADCKAIVKYLSLKQPNKSNR